MTLQDRIEALKQKHAALDRALDEENKRPLPPNELWPEVGDGLTG